MEYTFDNNGIVINAAYNEDEIDTIFIPLLKRLSKMHSEKGGRILVMLAAPPGAGKSTLAGFLQHLSSKAIPEKKVQAIGMDGFHRRQEYLVSHTTLVDGREVKMVDIKGAPVTFDLERLKMKLSEVALGRNIGWPMYNRLSHNPDEDAIFVDGDIIILEGNYLLLDEEGWKDLSDLADFTISVKADPDMLKKRLIERKIATGCPREKAIAFVEFSDMANVRLCLEKTKEAELELSVSDEGWKLISIREEVTTMTIAMANDHAGTQMKEEIKKYLVSQGYEVKDFGTSDENSCDLSDFVYPAALAVARGECDRGIFCDGVGYGSALIANKINGCYAAVCQDPLCATLARQHTDSNILCLGAKIIGGLMAMEVVKTWLSTEPLMEEKYRRRVQKVCDINDRHCVPVK